MEAINFSSLRIKLAETMDRVCNNHVPVIVTRKNAKSVVIISLEEFNSIQETAYLLNTPTNTKRLLESIKQAQSDKLKMESI